MTLCRIARPDELPAAAHVYLVAERELNLRLHGPTPRDSPTADEEEEAIALADLAALHEEASHNVWVAVEGDTVLGMASALIRERLWLLTYLFVLPEYQGRGIGRELLTRIHAVGVAAGCTVFSLFASDDPRAWTRYLTLGLTPQPPFI